MESIKKALFIVCLDKAVKFDNKNIIQAGANQGMHGGGSKLNSANRWFDKTIQFTISKNGFSGLNVENAPFDGQILRQMLEFIVNYM